MRWLSALPLRYPSAQNCGCHSPGLKAEGSAKILRMPLSAKARKANLGLGVDLEKEIRVRFPGAARGPPRSRANTP